MDLNLIDSVCGKNDNIWLTFDPDDKERWDYVPPINSVYIPVHFILFARLILEPEKYFKVFSQEFLDFHSQKVRMGESLLPKSIV